MSAPASEWEAVHAVHDYWDQPRSGVADFKAEPHVFSCLFDSDADEWSDVFVVRPIGEACFNLVVEAHGIFRRWRAVFDAGELSSDDRCFALPAEWARHEELRPQLAKCLEIDDTTAVRVIGRFERLSPGGVTAEWRVRWTPLER